jgi:hypothetical protein
MNTLKKNLKTPRAVEKLSAPGKVARRVRYDHNPFLEGVVATFGDKRIKVAMKPNLAEIDNSTGEITRIPGEITKIVSADNSSFIKLYSAEMGAFFELSGSAQGVVKYLIHVHIKEANKHLVVLHRTFAEQDGFEIPESTWFAGIRELIEKKFLAASKVPSSYYLNPAIFFNGDRTRFITEIVKQHKKTRGLSHAPASPALEGLDEDAF